MSAVKRRLEMADWVRLVHLGVVPGEFASLFSKPARDVKPGESWAFTEHRTMAEVIRDEESRSLTSRTTGR